jgi:hypothetical protein
MAVRGARPLRPRRRLLLAAAGVVSLVAGGLLAEGLRAAPASSTALPTGSSSEAASPHFAEGQPVAAIDPAIETLPPMIIDRASRGRLPPMIIDRPTPPSAASRAKRRKVARSARDADLPSANLLKNPFAGQP